MKFICRKRLKTKDLKWKTVNLQMRILKEKFRWQTCFFDVNIRLI